MAHGPQRGASDAQLLFGFGTTGGQPQAEEHRCKPRKEQRFWDFHRAHPEVYDKIVGLARAAKARGFRRYSMRTIWEKLRWHFEIVKPSGDEFKLNDPLVPYYDLLVMDREPDLRGFFEIRKLRS